MTTQPVLHDRSRQRTLAYRVFFVVLGVPALALVGAAGVALALPALAATFVLVPLGVVYGAMALALLAVRRRAAARITEYDLSATVCESAEFTLRLQRVNRAFHIVMLIVAAFSAALVALDIWQDNDGYVSNNYTAVGDTMLFLGSLLAAAIVVILVAIPFAAVLVTRQFLNRALLAGEEYALATRTGRWRRIRQTRILAAIDYSLYYALAAISVYFCVNGFSI